MTAFQSHQESIGFVVGTSSVAALYKDYRAIELLCKDKNNYSSYDRCIENDIPRTFPQSAFLKKHRAEFQKLLRAYVVYSPVGYVQGMNFIAAASLYFFSGKTMYLSFWLTVAIFDNLKHIFLLQIDESFLKANSMFDRSVEMVVDRFLSCYKRKHPAISLSDTVLLTLKNLVQWKLIGTLLLSCSGNDLTNTKHIVRYFLPYLYDIETFRKKAASVALAFLFCCLMEKEVNEEVILLVQGANLTENGLLEVLKTAKETEKLLF